MDFYQYTKELKGLYGLLQDPLSQKIFWARLRYDIEPNADNGVQLYLLRSGLPLEQRHIMEHWEEDIRRLNRAGKPIILYGTAFIGQTIAGYFLEKGLDFDGFVGRGWKKYPDGIMGKPVLAPDAILTSEKHPYILVSATVETGSYQEIVKILQDHQYPKEYVLPYFRPILSGVPEKYFEFPELFQQNTALVDCGAYKGSDSLAFSKWCGGNYSRIFAIEAEKSNADLCATNFQTHDLARVDVIPAAVTDHVGNIEFEIVATGRNKISEEAKKIQNTLQEGKTEKVSIPCVSIDSVVKQERVGLIKMDIEGSEYAALRGASETIKRDHPQLAICVYHKTGDMLAIMNLCRELVPEYRFWLRQYDVAPYETVMYAAVPKLKSQNL